MFLSLPFFRFLHFHKVTSSYSLSSTDMSYNTRTREIVLQAFAELGCPKHLFGLHILRTGGASAAANAGVSDRLFKRHFRWRTRIGPKMVMLWIVWNHYFQCRKVCMLSFLCSLSLIVKRALNEMPDPNAVFVFIKITYKIFIVSG